ncbi:thiol reductase thioredoxin [Bacillus cereus]|uniref:Thiol reductase thioredoxin n=1 Tax=Bacillus cereus TaxID=1396 RepID=A0A9X6B281_BACCE|nr:thioredoxin family protein [Bacillus cereus]OOR69499.1 thiol reductase thioredoxin [Bacillus cereus]
MIILLCIAIFIEKKQDRIAEKDYYSNTISFSDLRKNIGDKKEQIVYFYQTSCIHCKKVSPIIVPLAKKLGIDMKVINIENVDSVWDEYNIVGTPTIIHFKDGKEKGRISGENSSREFKKWFAQIKVK